MCAGELLLASHVSEMALAGMEGGTGMPCWLLLGL